MPLEGPTTKIIEDEAEWDLLRRDWDELFAASPTASTPLDYAWLSHWWQIYKPTLRDGALRVVTVQRSQQLIGAIPLYVHRGSAGPFGVRRLGFISTGEAEFEETCPDYMNLLHLPGEETVCVDAIWRAVERLDWDLLDLLDLPENTPLLESDRCPAARPSSRGQCPVADLSGGFDEYIAQLNTKTRQHARQYLRSVDRHGAILQIATEGNVNEFFEELIQLHQQRWVADGKPGCFAAARFTEFHRTLARAWVPLGRAALARLSHEGQSYAVLYGFITGSKFDFYQSGVARLGSGPFDSPGTTANLLLMRALAERGVKFYDFLRGSSSYKERLATRQNQLIGIRAQRFTPRAVIYQSFKFAGRLFRKGLRLMKQRRA